MVSSIMTFHNKICDRLFLGSVESSTTFSFLEENNISVIVGKPSFPLPPHPFNFKKYI